ncbi:MAG: low-specificity L-threonine aldolase [Pseudomonadota bacterium]
MTSCVDLRSDTVTQPTAGMRAAIQAAEVGDDVYGDDPSVNALQETIAARLGKESALFVTSGTQSNLIALLAHCERGDEYIAGQAAHLYRLEAGGAAVLGGVQPQPVEMLADGSLNLDAVRAAIKPDDPHFARTRVVCLENTHAGKAHGLERALKTRQLCDEHGLALHLDGARLFNAAHALGVAPNVVAAPYDSVSVCLSKGLGAPVGSVLLGSRSFIHRAHRLRKMLGGGLRQAGVLAAAGLYALNNHVDRLADDHRRAERVADTLNAWCPGCAEPATNMVFVAFESEDLQLLKRHLFEQRILIRGPRWVFHLGIDDSAVDCLMSHCAALVQRFRPPLEQRVESGRSS